MDRPRVELNLCIWSALKIKSSIMHGRSISQESKILIGAADYKAISKTRLTKTCWSVSLRQLCSANSETLVWTCHGVIKIWSLCPGGKWSSSLVQKMTGRQGWDVLFSEKAGVLSKGQAASTKRGWQPA